MSRIERSTLISAPRARVHMVTTHPDYAGIGFDIVVQDVVPDERFSWKWQPGVPDENTERAKEPWTTVEFRLADEGGGTRVTLTESGFEQLAPERRARVFAEQDKGWQEQLRNLGDYLAHRAQARA